MKGVIENLETWQKIAGAVLITFTLWNVIPDSWKPLTHGSHDEKSAFSDESQALENIHYYEWKQCDRETGEPNGKVLSMARQIRLEASYNMYLEIREQDYPLRYKEQTAKCKTLFEDDL